MVETRNMDEQFGERISSELPLARQRYKSSSRER
jgi:hypothetical protein